MRFREPVEPEFQDASSLALAYGEKMKVVSADFSQDKYNELLKWYLDQNHLLLNWIQHQLRDAALPDYSSFPTPEAFSQSIIAIYSDPSKMQYMEKYTAGYSVYVSLSYQNPPPNYVKPNLWKDNNNDNTTTTDSSNDNNNNNTNNNTNSQEKPFAEYSPFEISEWLKGLSLSKDYTMLVKEQALDGEVFLEIGTDKALMKEAGFSVLGDLLKISKAVGALKSN